MKTYTEDISDDIKYSVSTIVEDRQFPLGNRWETHKGQEGRVAKGQLQREKCTAFTPIPSPLPWGPLYPKAKEETAEKGECKRLGYNLSERKEEFELGIRAYSCTLELFDN
ncbi:hypothetical protein TNCV_4859921 [Trichonephila clavipes]|nr:hypothetical protein TNCV_4859921 [Trichonephila clavipes]